MSVAETLTPTLTLSSHPTTPSHHPTLGLALKELGFEGKPHGNQMFYRVVPLKAA